MRLLVGKPWRFINNLILLQIAPRIAAESACQRDKNSLLIRSLTSPVATATLNGLVFDQLGAVNESFNICSINSGGTGVGRKSRVVLRDEMNSETQAPSS
jgi:hypothetical protein